MRAQKEVFSDVNCEIVVQEYVIYMYAQQMALFTFNSRAPLSTWCLIKPLENSKIFLPAIPVINR